MTNATTAAAEAVMVAAAIAATSASAGGSGASSLSSKPAAADGSIMSQGSPEGFEIEVSGSALSAPTATGPISLASLLKDSVSENDKLNLAALLNVLDGEKCL